uniref:Uncharacterized protein n=1 Tax=Rhizophora mucronata TaxID=61149 RepID=A0A2P2JMQ3_RHIMU
MSIKTKFMSSRSFGHFMQEYKQSGVHLVARL